MDTGKITERMPPVPASGYSEQQRSAADEFRATRGVDPFGPFASLIRSPELLSHVQHLGSYLRYGNSLGTRLTELVILVTAREWNQQFEWAHHAPIALKQGIPLEVIEAIARGTRPELGREEAACYDFSLELHRIRQVSDATYGTALALFGERGVVDLTAVNGYYALLAMALNVMGTPGADPDFVLPDLRRTD